MRSPLDISEEISQYARYRMSDSSISSSDFSSSSQQPLKGACIIAQSGGPTAVINASALGAIETALDSPFITQTLGAAYGIEGILKENLFDMGLEDREELKLLRYTPSSALGSCRYKMSDPQDNEDDYKRLLEVFEKYNVRYFFYNGGNDSMDTCNKVSKYMESAGYDCRVIGIPKTIDNDLCGTDHCPGYSSAARYIATSCMELNQDVRVYEKGRITVVEIMGRHAGWLAGSAALASAAGAGPDLIYLPEVPFDMEQFLRDAETVYNKQGSCMVAVSEGIRYADGRFVAEALGGDRDVFGHVQLGGLASLLAEAVRKRTGIKVRGIELSLLQRCAAHIASETDRNEAYAAGKFAVESALAGATDRMAAFRCKRKAGEYTCELALSPLADVANSEKTVPRAWINEKGNNVTQEFIDYALPLIQGSSVFPTENALPRFAHLRKIKAQPRKTV